MNWHSIDDLADPQAGRTALLTPVRSVSEAATARKSGARLAEVTDSALVDQIHDAVPGLIVCANHAGADVVYQPALAAQTGAGLICESAEAAGQAVAAGVSRERILVIAEPAGLDRIAGAGWAALTDADSCAGATGTPGAVAIAAICAWLGVAVVRSRHVTQVRRGLDMAASILGTRPPAWAIRGLA